MTFPKPNSLILATRTRYVTVFERLMKNAVLRHPDSKSVLIAIVDRVIDDLISNKPTIRPSTFRQYKASVLHVLNEFSKQPTLSDVRKVLIQSAIDRLAAEASTGSLRKSNKTSARKAKAFPARDAALVTRFLEHPGRRSVSAKPTLSAMRILGLLGARPVELASLRVATLGPGCAEVQIRNAKATNGRGLGEFRTIHFKGLTDQELAELQNWNATLAELGRKSTPQAAIKTLSRYFRDVVRRVLGKRPKYPALYSLRHQFAADAKASGCPPEEVSGLMGHGSDVTAMRSYGRRASGRGGMKAKASASEVAHVRRRAKTFKPGNGSKNGPR